MSTAATEDPAAAGAALFPEIEPYRKDWLPADAGHRIYFEESGNPAGFPVLFLHGGPGSRTRPAHRRYFDPAFYRIVLLDQRGCGQSLPAGSLEANTTQHLVVDIQRLRSMLGVKQWLLFGGSWGSTLALAYAIAFPDAVAGMVLRGIFLGSDREIRWYLSGMKRFIPEAWRVFSGGSDEHIVMRYQATLDHPDRLIALAAARRWYDYEARTMSMGDMSADTGAPPEEELLARVRVQVHYLAHQCFLAPGEVLENLWRLRHVPTTIVQGRLDMVCPPETAAALAERLPQAELHLVRDAGHSGTQPAIASRLCAAVAGMQALLK